MSVKYSGRQWNVESGSEGWVLTHADDGPEEHDGRTLLLKELQVWECSRDGLVKPLMLISGKDVVLASLVAAEMGGPWVPPVTRTGGRR